MTSYKVIVKLDDGRQGTVKVTESKALAYHLRKVYAQSYRNVFVKEYETADIGKLSK